MGLELKDKTLITDFLNSPPFHSSFPNLPSIPAASTNTQMYHGWTNEKLS